MRLINANNTYIDPRASIADDAVIYPNNHIIGACKIGERSVLMPNNILTDCVVGGDCTITASVICGATIGDKTSVGPYAYLRPQTVVGNNCRVGDFVELKNANIGNGTKVSHLAYLGDCEVGEDCNIGCGVIFVNYDGVSKHKTIVGDKCFIGSNCNIIAPAHLADKCYVAAGTTVDGDAEEDCFVIGRVRAEYKPARASKLKEKLASKHYNRND